MLIIMLFSFIIRDTLLDIIFNNLTPRILVAPGFEGFLLTTPPPNLIHYMLLVGSFLFFLLL